MKQLRIMSMAAATLLAGAIACSDPAAPTLQKNVPTAPLLDAQTTDGGILPGGSGLSAGQVRLCKTTPAGDPGLPWSFTISAATEVVDGVPTSAVVSPVVIAGASGQTACTIVYTSAKSGSGLDRVTITEQALPADWALTHLHIVQYIDGPGYTPPAPGMTDAGSLATRTATVYVNNDMERVVTFENDYTSQRGNLGCTPGYWKQPQHFDSWTAPYTPASLFNAVFGIGTNWFPDTYTLLAGASAKGGGQFALARHAVAALLNAAHPTNFYPLTTAEVIQHVQQAYANPSLIEAKKELLAALNEEGCPLN